MKTTSAIQNVREINETEKLNVKWQKKTDFYRTENGERLKRMVKMKSMLSSGFVCACVFNWMTSASFDFRKAIEAKEQVNSTS